VILTLAVICGVCALCALVPALVFRKNLALYAPAPPVPEEGPRPAVSVLIPARDEERVIAAAVRSALASRGVELEVVVLDDDSRDRTADIVAGLADLDPRVRFAVSPPLAPGWCGKQHACAALAALARHPFLLFLDADVRLGPHGVARAVAFLESRAAAGVGLVSGVPRQETATFLERLLIPLIHFVLLGFLPMARMRQSVHPAYGAGCGQLFLARRDAYVQAGGHRAIHASLHDGLALPRAFRRAGIGTDLFDATGVASCRMYRNAGEVWRGLAKNAVEGLAAPGKIVPVTVLFLAGQVLPPLLLLLALTGAVPAWTLWVAVPATLAAYLPRLAAARRFRQPLDGAVLHPLGILVFLAIQWWALGRHLLGLPATWKGRRYDPRPSS
jgi:hypothetical protein